MIFSCRDWKNPAQRGWCHRVWFHQSEETCHWFVRCHVNGKCVSGRIFHTITLLYGIRSWEWLELSTITTHSMYSGQEWIGRSCMNIDTWRRFQRSQFNCSFRMSCQSPKTFQIENVELVHILHNPHTHKSDLWGWDLLKSKKSYQCSTCEGCFNSYPCMLFLGKLAKPQLCFVGSVPTVRLPVLVAFAGHRVENAIPEKDGWIWIGQSKRTSYRIVLSFDSLHLRCKMRKESYCLQ